MTEKQEDLVQRVKDDSMIALPAMIGAGLGAIAQIGLITPVYASICYFANKNVSFEPQDLIYGAIGGALAMGGCAIVSRRRRIKEAEKEMAEIHYDNL